MSVGGPHASDMVSGFRAELVGTIVVTQSRTLSFVTTLHAYMTTLLCRPRCISWQARSYPLNLLWSLSHTPQRSSCSSRRPLHTMASTDITDPSDIPTLADLYSSRELPAYDDAEVEHNADLNTKISIWRGQSTASRACRLTVLILIMQAISPSLRCALPFPTPPELCG